MGNANDPRENKTFVFKSVNIPNNEYFNDEERNWEITQMLRKDCKLLCLSSDHSPYLGYEYSRLWTTYGENHKGICIGLNREKFLKENVDKISIGSFKKVNYQKLDTKNLPPHKIIDYDKVKELGLSEYLKKEFRPEHLDFLFFTKNEEWESEREYRMLYYSENAEYEYCSIAESFFAIYLGVDFDFDNLPRLRSVCGGTPIYHLEFIEGLRLTDRLVRD